jgi:hypothetical protein
MSMTDTITGNTIRFDQDVEERLDKKLSDDDLQNDYSGWYCVKTDPFPCPAPDCVFVAHFMTAAHLIIVWPEMDDPGLLKQAQKAKNYGRNPRVVEYEPSMGKCITWDQWRAIGRPIHGQHKPPEGW